MDTRAKRLLFGSMLTVGLFLGVVFHYLLMPLLQGLAYCLATAILMQVVNYMLYSLVGRKLARKRIYQRYHWHCK